MKVILGEDREATGVLLSIDGEDGIVRMELDEQLKILNLRFLGKLEAWANALYTTKQHHVELFVFLFFLFVCFPTIDLNHRVIHVVCILQYVFYYESKLF